MPGEKGWVADNRFHLAHFQKLRRRLAATGAELRAEWIGLTALRAFRIFHQGQARLEMADASDGFEAPLIRVRFHAGVAGVLCGLHVWDSSARGKKSGGGAMSRRSEFLFRVGGLAIAHRMPFVIAERDAGAFALRVAVTLHLAALAFVKHDLADIGAIVPAAARISVNLIGDRRRETRRRRISLGRLLLHRLLGRYIGERAAFFQSAHQRIGIQVCDGIGGCTVFDGEADLVFEHRHKLNIGLESRCGHHSFSRPGCQDVNLFDITDQSLLKSDRLRRLLFFSHRNFPHKITGTAPAGTFMTDSHDKGAGLGKPSTVASRSGIGPRRF